MNILYLHQYFVTPDEYGATRSYWICKRLLEQGHKVTVISALGSSTKRPKGEHEIEGIKVIYIGDRYSNLLSPLKKVYLFIQFCIQSLRAGLRQKDIDLVFATSTPLTVGATALLFNKLKKMPYIFEVRDLWPEFPIQIGVIKNGLLIKFLLWLEKKIYKKSSHIIALSPGMQESILNGGVPAKKVTVVPNMSKPDIFYPRPKNKEVQKRFGLEDEKFYIVYFGALGYNNGLEYIMDAATLLHERNEQYIHFVFAGYGAMENALKSTVEKMGLNNVKFVGKHNTESISELVNCCDISIVSFMNIPVTRTNSPNKFFDSLSAGKPVIVNMYGWTKELVEKHAIGFFADPESPADLADKLQFYSKRTEDLKVMGSNARKISIEEFDKDKLASAVADVVSKVGKELRIHQN